ncbi:hypothetical protein L596_017392 [Steinernema carpocapsae]|uniref:Protein TsetseEP domain-containing protein n=1 Tax=Steinernema carpocapsae TaxID=34508 RepID=A0A4U5N1R5_STECR|nr:hypothetical protein L596_017392 [Steinernema carpocapsae]
MLVPLLALSFIVPTVQVHALPYRPLCSPFSYVHEPASVFLNATQYCLKVTELLITLKDTSNIDQHTDTIVDCLRYGNATAQWNHLDGHCSKVYDAGQRQLCESTVKAHGDLESIVLLLEKRLEANLKLLDRTSEEQTGFIRRAAIQTAEIVSQLYSLVLNIEIVEKRQYFCSLCRSQRLPIAFIEDRSIAISDCDHNNEVLALKESDSDFYRNAMFTQLIVEF